MGDFLTIFDLCSRYRLWNFLGSCCSLSDYRWGPQWRWLPHRVLIENTKWFSLRRENWSDLFRVSVGSWKIISFHRKCFGKVLKTWDVLKSLVSRIEILWTGSQGFAEGGSESSQIIENQKNFRTWGFDCMICKDVTKRMSPQTLVWYWNVRFQGNPGWMVKDFSSPGVVSHKYSHISCCCLNKMRCLSTFYLDVTYCTTSDLLQACYTSYLSSIDQLQDETIFPTEKCNKSCQTQAWKLGKGQCHMKSTPLPASWWTKESIAWRHHVFFLRSYLGCGVYHFYHSFHNPNAIENYNYNYTTCSIGFPMR